LEAIRQHVSAISRYEWRLSVTTCCLEFCPPLKLDNSRTMLYYSSRHYISYLNKKGFQMGLGLSALGRFSEPGMLVLLSLAEGDKHGYAMLIDAKDTFGVKLGPGTLYQAIDRLQHQGLIEALPSTDRRRPYRITALGVRELEAQLENMQRFLATGKQRLAIQ
jgi:DNA-binding MarR family transcriptional regulator